MTTIYEKKTNLGNNETSIQKGIYKTPSGYKWLTYTKSGECKNLKTAMKKVGIEKI